MCDRNHATIAGVRFGKWGYRLFMVCLSLLSVIQLIVLYLLVFN